MAQNKLVPYVTDAKLANDIMEYPPMHTLDIGARASGMPKTVSNLKAIDHVSNNAIGSTQSKLPSV